MSNEAVCRRHLCGEDNAAMPYAEKSIAGKNKKHSENLKSITPEQDKSVVEIRRFFVTS